MRMTDVAPVHVREWITRLKDQDVSASTIADLKTVLSAIFTTALNDQIAAIHPCRGVKTPTVARKPRTIVTPEQFDLIHSALPEQRWQVLIELDVESGLRWGELTELRVRDFNAPSGCSPSPARSSRSTPASATRRTAVRRQGVPEGQGVPQGQTLPRDRHPAS